MRGYLRSPGHYYHLETDVISIGKGTNRDIVPPAQFRNAGAHIPLSSGKAEPCHAVVERNNEGNCFTLTDLNTSYGTYVNEHRIQNGAVKLMPGDLIRFGHGGIPHEFGVITDDESSVTTPRSSQVTSARSTRPSSYLGNRKIFVETGSFGAQGKNRPISAQSQLSPVSSHIISTRPETAPMNNNRSGSSPLLKLIMEERSKSVPLSVKMSSLESIEGPKMEPVEFQKTESTAPPATQEGWSIDGQDAMDTYDRETMFSKASSWDKEHTDVEPWYVAMLREKEQRLLHMGDEISRLSVTEAECRRKDGVITDLRKKVADLEIALADFKNNTNAQQRECKLLQMGDEINRLSVFERECERKDKLVASLRDQVAKLEVDRQAYIMESPTPDPTKSTLLPSNTNLLSESDEKIENQKEITEKLDENINTIDDALIETQNNLDDFRKQLQLPPRDTREPQEIIMELVLEMEEKDEIISDLKEELKKVEHDKTVSHGVVKAQQRDLSRAEHKVTKLKIALEKAQRDSQEASDKAQAMSNKFSNLKEEKKHEEIVAMIEKELCESHEKLQVAQIKLSQQQEKLDALSKELRRSNRQSKQYLESGKLSQLKVEELNNELAELRQKELGSRVSNEQALSRLERLRSRVVQAVYMAPGAMRPEARLEDSEILNSVQKLINDRSEFHQQLSDLGQNMPPLIITLDPLPDENGDNDATANVADRKSSKTAKKLAKK